MFNLYDIVRLKQEDTKYGVKTSYEGIIVDVQSGGKDYTVEFFDEKGETVFDALFRDYSEDMLELIQEAH